MDRAPTENNHSGPGKAGADRDRSAEDRDARAKARDQVSEARDESAAARDGRAEVREAKGDTTGAPTDRAGASRDRRGGADDRSRASDDREAASADRGFSAEERAASFVDELTGAYRREAGMLVLEHDLAKAERTKQPFTVAFIDVDGLKTINDSMGHAAGDQMLRATVDAMRSLVRPYDVIVRYGGDEFLCGLTDLTMADASSRSSLVSAHLATHPEQVTVTVGLAEFEAGDALDDLIARADKALYRERQRLRSPDA